MSIKVHQLSKNYGAQKAVNNISFEINKGEIVGFLGPNGAGKSTTMKMITGYLVADEGTILVDGIDVAKDVVAAKSKIGYLPEANPLYADMYVREYLHFVAGVHQLKNIKQQTEKMIATVGLTNEAHKKMSQLSKGYKQRVGIAAALIHEPEVVILDEPTSGLDPNQIIEIRNVIKALSVNKTVLFSSHILQEVEAICDRVIIINKGSIVADDQLQHLQKNIQPTQVVQVQFEELVELTMLQTIPQVLHVEMVNPHIFKIETAAADAVRKQLLQLAVTNNLNIVALQTDTNSLEDTFRAVTK
ncbi:gliding motility-associated ABC transporter ATP-binding subunit GldA [Ferruginibacter yonginensis]|uniref:Gliding motility-associated ABC transporter ATP-binding subunit GldA n=1 Tax=Ferruginibacter yonginensis TaxID=1310416 RepID=A0ABV8QSI3_9BACT